MDARGDLLTEQRLRESISLDQMSSEQIVALMNAQDALAVAAVGAEQKAIARAIDLVVPRLRSGGRLIYFGAGTSGRLGVLDASEIPPTFRADPTVIQGVIAGGEAAMFRAQEGAEDDADAGAAAVDRLRLGPADVAMGIAAGGTTPFVHGALRRAIALGCGSIFLSCVQPVPDEPVVDVVIRPLTGPEVVTGSTRLKAGTATKLVLNTLSTAAMVQLGKVHENLMVDLRASNQKLWSRAARLVMTLTGLDAPAATALLRQADGHVKTAVVMWRHALAPDAARALLERHHQRLRPSLEDDSLGRNY